MQRIMSQHRKNIDRRDDSEKRAVREKGGKEGREAPIDKSLSPIKVEGDEIGHRASDRDQVLGGCLLTM